MKALNKRSFSAVCIFAAALILLSSVTARAAYRAGGESAGQLALLAVLRDGDSAEIEFKIIEDEGEGSNFYLGAGDEFHAFAGFRFVKKDEAWVGINSPFRSMFLVNRPGIGIYVNPKGVNKLRFERKEGWVTAKINGVPLFSAPFVDNISWVSMKTDGTALEYRWTERNFKELSRKQQFDIEGGHYSETFIEHHLLDGDEIKYSFKINEFHIDPRWANSFVLIIDNTTLWLNFHDEKMYPSLSVWNGQKKVYRPPLPLKKKGFNEVSVFRQGDVLRFFLNGKFMFKCRHRAETAMNEDFYVKKRMVGLDVTVFSKKVKTNAGKRGKNFKWSATPSSKDKYKGMKTVDAKRPKETVDTPVFAKLREGETVRIYFDIIRGYPSKEASTDIGFDLDDKRFFIRKLSTFPLYLLDPDNHQNFDNMIPFELKDGINYVDYKRNGDTYKIYLNDRLIKSYTNTASSPKWELKIRVFGLKAKYRAKKMD